jgi:hypothetical protein
MRMKRKRLAWSASISPDVSGYKLYWSKSGNVDYDSVHVELGNVTHVLLPDDIPSFPVTDRIEIGITTVNLKGNESDMVRVMLQFEFADAEENLRLVRLRPGIEGWEPPLNTPILIDGLNHWIIENVYADGSLSHHTRHYIAESHHEEWTIESQTPQKIQKGVH